MSSAVEGLVSAGTSGQDEDPIYWYDVFADELAPTGNLVNRTLKALSICAAVYVMAGYCLLARSYPQLASRVSLRLGVCISVADLLCHTAGLLRVPLADSTSTAAEMAKCRLATWYQYFSNQLPSWFVAMIALNLLLSFLGPWVGLGQGRLQTHRYWYLFVLGAVVPCFVVSLGLILDAARRGICWQGLTITTVAQQVAFNNIAYVPWYTIPVGFSVIVLSLVALRMYMQRRQNYRRMMEAAMGSGTFVGNSAAPAGAQCSQPSQGQHHLPVYLKAHNPSLAEAEHNYRVGARLNRVIARILCYPIFPIIQYIMLVFYWTRVPILDGYDRAQAREAVSIRMMNTVLSGTGGLINAVVFTFDPALDEPRRALACWLRRQLGGRRPARSVAFSASPLTGSLSAGASSMETLYDEAPSQGLRHRLKSLGSQEDLDLDKLLEEYIKDL
ncbi:hypothetical protein EV182_000720 [Spiromyces aspiralis]|uniref:Uncharacterized protein n=1 Tax=Spiromyces aspiralis TaxID=68401 RepID=A0ACC1HXW5_9FUNG|nr:hypothetical protein EV182_000720 [Spiromyces aspiralis]